MSIILPTQIFENGSCSGLSFCVSSKDEEYNGTDLIYSSFVMSVCMEQLSSHGSDFSGLLIHEYFPKICPAKSSFIKTGQERRVLYMKTNVYFQSYLTQFFLEWEMFQTKVVKKLEKHILCTIIFFFGKSCCLWDNVDTYCRVGQATDDNKAHAHCTLDT